MPRSHSSCQNCLYSLNSFELLATLAASDPTENVVGHGKQKQYWLASLPPKTRLLLPHGVALSTLRLLVAGRATICCWPCSSSVPTSLSSSSHFKLMWKLRNLFSQKIVYFRDECQGWQFVAMNGNLCIKFYSVIFSFCCIVLSTLSLVLFVYICAHSSHRYLFNLKQDI